MAKVLLVEDDNALREIFEQVLQTEGFETVTAANGEEGLTVALQEKPDLIITDVMMPKLSGFEMLENLRAIPEGKNAKVIMMTALGQAEDQARGEKLGVVKYLVKSQAGLEDLARVVREVLPPDGANAPATDNKANGPSPTNKQESEKKMPEEPTTPTNPDPAVDPTTPTGDNSAAPMGDQTVPSPIPEPAAPSADAEVAGDQQSTAQEQSAVDSQINDFVASTPAVDPAAPSADSVASEPAADLAAGSFTPSEPASDNPVATPGAPDMSAPNLDTSVDAPAVPPATPPADTPPATPPQTDTPAPSADTPPSDQPGTI